MKHDDPAFPRTILAGCLAVLLMVLFYRVFLHDHQFAYRDAAHYYYPLYQRVQTDWDAGRWPLWEPEENAGMPLLGNPTAAVLYPGKLIYWALPYAWGARVYILAHLALAFAAAVAMMRSWRASWTASGLSALAYTFSGPILFQYCNVIYLVGAAWLPLGVLAVDRWIRLGSRRALLGLAFVLSMQTLGGDPQASYLLGLCACGYAVGVSWTSGRGFAEEAPPEPIDAAEASPRRSRGRWWVYPIGLAGLVAWVWITLELARVFPGMRPPRPPDQPTPPLPWMRWVPAAVATAWGLALVFLLLRRRRSKRNTALERLSLGLVAAASLAVMISAAQLLPVLEFTQQTSRAAEEGPHDIYPFSVEPHRLVEMLWPNVFGSYFRRNASWSDLIKLGTVRAKIWTPSLYMGAFIVVLALRAFSIRRGEGWRVWLSIIVVITLLGSFGQFTSPIWAARLLERETGNGWPGIGPLDPQDVTPLRMDRYLRDGDGSVYWALSHLLPGFRQFRFPSKLMTFSILGLAALAGFGWDDLSRGKRRGTIAATASALVVTIAAMAAWLIERPTILRAFGRDGLGSGFGPFLPEAAYQETVRGLGQGALVLTIALAILATIRSRPRLAGMAALALVSADLAVANRGMIATVPQSLFDAEPEVMGIIREAERKDPASGPFRIHRMAIWDPPAWTSKTSDDRIREFMEWEHATIQPKYGINFGVEYTHTMGVAELYDYEWYFGPFPRKVGPEFAAHIGVAPGSSVVYYPRRSFDMWNTRYFIVPSYPGDWNQEFRGYASFIPDSEAIHPRPITDKSPEAMERVREWVENRDYQILRNKRMFPRAWIVHKARSLPAMVGTTRQERAGPMQEMLYQGDPIWNNPALNVFDPLELAWIESDDREALDLYTRGFAPRPTEKVEVSYPHGARVEMTATLENPGVVVLADIFYPGWKLTIDGEPAPIYRANRMMRGAAVPAGVHKLVYSYEPDSFRVGGYVTLAGLGLSVLFAGLVAIRPRSPLPWSPVDPIRTQGD